MGHFCRLRRMCGRIFFFFFFFFFDDDDESVASLERVASIAFRKNNPRPLSLSFHISCLGFGYKIRVSNRRSPLFFFSPALKEWRQTKRRRRQQQQQQQQQQRLTKKKKKKKKKNENEEEGDDVYVLLLLSKKTRVVEQNRVFVRVVVVVVVVVDDDDDDENDFFFLDYDFGGGFITFASGAGLSLRSDSGVTPVVEKTYEPEEKHVNGLVKPGSREKRRKF